MMNGDPMAYGIDDSHNLEAKIFLPVLHKPVTFQGCRWLMNMLRIITMMIILILKTMLEIMAITLMMFMMPVASMIMITKRYEP